MYLFFEKSMSGWVSYTSKRYSQTNNKYILYANIYLDANNLYCYAMSKFLPTIGFKWISPK